MATEFKGSAPEKMDFGPSDEKMEWENRHFTANEVEKCGPRANDWRPKKKIGLPDPRKVSKAWREGYEAIDWSAKLEVVDGKLVVIKAS